MARDSMHRTQISLEKWQYRYVVDQALRTRTSISEIIRRLISEQAGRVVAGQREGDPIFGIIGIASGSGQPVGREHDRYLYSKE